MSLKVTVLGSGTSHGVPAIGCGCAVCTSTDPRDRRMRPSICLELGEADPAASPFAARTRSILIDTSTDLRAQALTYNIRRVDAILFTHCHADHVFGLDDVRRFNAMQKSAIACYGDRATMRELRRMFAYIFAPSGQVGGGIPQLVPFAIAGPFTIGGVEIVPVRIYHGRMPILGFRIGAFAYLTDCSRIPDESWPLLDGVKTIIIDALRHRSHPTHFTVDEAIAASARIGAERTYFTHICHDLPHAATCAQLPGGVELAYDGLVLEIAS